ncbi:MAG: 50S ribosomal protein L30 [Thermoleophilia bacterium]|nr:50S ribosomal protein L30 [Thermoleophilia bacterium]
MLKITQVKSAIGRKQDHKDTLRALGIGRMGQSVYQDDNPVIRGMIHKIDYMLQVSEVDPKDEG